MKIHLNKNSELISQDKLTLAYIGSLSFSSMCGPMHTENVSNIVYQYVNITYTRVVNLGTTTKLC